MPSVLDPQNPVHFVPNALIPTELDRTKVAYGLAQAIADGPSVQKLGGTSTPPAVQTFGPVAAQSGARSVGVQTQKLATGPSGARNLGGFVYGASGVQQLGKYVYHPEAGCSPENPA